MKDNEITKENVLHIAKLCNLTLSEDEILKLSSMLTKTLDSIDVLEELDTKNTLETHQVTGMVNVFQQNDDVKTTLTQQESLQNAHEVIKNMFATKAVFDR